MNPWLTAVLVLSQVAGIAGFGLGLYNLHVAKSVRRDNLQAPARADQRLYRKELREILLNARNASSEAKMALSFGDYPPPIPESVLVGYEKLKELEIVLKNPPWASLVSIGLQLEKVHRRWEDALRIRDRIKSDLAFDEEIGKSRQVSDSAMRKREAAFTELREALSDFMGAASAMIDDTVRLDEAF